MGAAEILQLVGEALSVLPTLINAGVNVIDRIQSIKALSDAGASGTATADQVAAVRAQLDADLAEFNAPM